jgi:hypothetical protein
MQFFMPENWFTVRRALLKEGREDLIGSGPQCLIPEKAPKEALAARRRDANSAVRGSKGGAGAKQRSKGRSSGSGRG